MTSITDAAKPDLKEILNEVYGNRKKNVNEKNNVKRASLNNW